MRKKYSLKNESKYDRRKKRGKENIKIKYSCMIHNTQTHHVHDVIINCIQINHTKKFYNKYNRDLLSVCVVHLYSQF